MLVMTDLFPMYAIAVHLVTTDSAGVGVPNVLRTDQGKSFLGKLTQERCRLLGIDKIHRGNIVAKKSSSDGATS